MFVFYFGLRQQHSIIQANMANASLTFHKILLLSILLYLALQQCPANTKLPQFFKNDINLAMMRADRSSAQIGTRRTLYYASNYPIELITRSSSANIDSVLSIQRLETGNLLNGLNYKVKQIRSQTSLLITVQYYELEWKDLSITVLQFSKSSYPRLSFGQLSLSNAESRLTLSSTAKLNLAGSTTGLGYKSVLFIVGLKVRSNQQSNYDVEVTVTDRIDEANKQYVVNVNAGSNTILSEIYINYIVFAPGLQYEMEGGYYTFSEVLSGEYLRYMSESISASNYFLAGISSLQFKQGNMAFSYKISQKKAYQNTLSLTNKNPFALLKVVVFRVSAPISQVCAACGSQNLLQALTDKPATCVSACTQGVAVRSKCLLCPADINFELFDTEGKCSCVNGLTSVNGQCLSETAAKQVAINSATFSRADSDCTDSNAVKGSDGVCKCKFGYQKKQMFNNYECTPICQPLQFYNGQSCTICPMGTYPWPDLQTCLPCCDQCKTCGSYFTCKQCYPGFQNNVNNQCVEVCGDGLRISNECDDGNVFNGDGCSSDCKIEAGWKCQGSLGSKSICSNQGYRCTRKGSTLMSGNLIVEYQVDPQPPKVYSPSQLQQLLRIKFTQSPPYQNYLVQNPANPSIFRLVATYGGNAPILPAIIEVQFTLPNNQVFKDTVQQNFIMGNGRNFALRGGGGANDVLK